jgi:predicted acyl esterase
VYVRWVLGGAQEDVVVMGRPKLVLWVRCLSAGAVQADFVGRLCDVFPSGRSINICDGVKRLHFEHAHRDPRGAFKVEVDIYPTAVRFAKGHRLRLHVASAGFCRWERNLCGYGYESLIPVRFEVLHGGLYPAEASHVELPVVRLEDLKPCTAP